MALGHWLKDYLGPKASGEGGGSEGGASEFVVKGSDFTGTSMTLDKTFSEITSAYENGQRVILDAQVYSTHYIVPLGMVTTSQLGFGAIFYGFDVDNIYSTFIVKVGSDDTVAVTMKNQGR